MKYSEKKRSTMIKIIALGVVLILGLVIIFDFTPTQETKQITIPYTRP